MSERKSKITKEEALAFKKRWEMVNELEKEELRNTTPYKKILQLSLLMLSVKAFPQWDEALKLEEDEVRQRWNKLKRYCASK